MDDPDDGASTRAPEPEDVVRICQALNGSGARYVLIGGFAVIAHGASRFTSHPRGAQTPQFTDRYRNVVVTLNCCDGAPSGTATKTRYVPPRTGIATAPGAGRVMGKA